MAGVVESTDLNGLASEMKLVAGDLGSPLDPFLRQCEVDISGDLKRRMTQSVSPDGTPYLPLKFPRPRGGSKPLLDEGTLRASLTGGPNHVARFGSDWLESGTNLDYAGTHQRGGVIKPGSGKRFLAIPVSREAARVGRALHFPKGRLFAVVAPGGRSGVLIERKAAKGVKGLRAALKRLRRKGAATAGAATGATNMLRAAILRRMKAAETVHYALVKSVTVPARPFVGFAVQLIDRLAARAQRFFYRISGGPRPTDAMGGD